MNEPIEDILKRQRLRKPSGALDRRVKDELAQAEEPAGPFRLGGWLLTGGALAAALAGLALIPLASTTPQDQAAPQPRSVARQNPTAEGGAHPSSPVQIEQVWSSFHPGRVVLTDGDLPLRPFQHVTFERTQWTDRDRGVQMEWIRPRSETVFISAPVD